MYALGTQRNNPFIMEKNLANRIISGFEGGILRKFRPVEAGDTPKIVTRPEELIAVIKGKAGNRGRDSMCPRWGQEQSIDLWIQKVSIHLLKDSDSVFDGSLPRALRRWLRR
jgi:hypothetical protein